MLVHSHDVDLLFSYLASSMDQASRLYGLPLKCLCFHEVGSNPNENTSTFTTLEVLKVRGWQYERNLLDQLRQRQVPPQLKRNCSAHPVVSMF